MIMLIYSAKANPQFRISYKSKSDQEIYHYQVSFRDFQCERIDHGPNECEDQSSGDCKSKNGG
jgi:hypothetical protein